ncbi:MAG: FAD-dependent oxidoreductase [Thermoleophilaceae bacterium]
MISEAGPPQNPCWGSPQPSGCNWSPYPVATAARLDDQVELQPTAYTQGLAAAVEGEGSFVFEGTRALSVEAGLPCRVRTSGATVTAGQVVDAAHYLLLDRGLYFARLEPMRSYCIAARVRGAPPQGLSISAGSTTRSLRSYGDLLILGGEGHETGAGEASPARYDRLEQFARRHWDVDGVTHRWSAQDPVPYDNLPVVGRYTPRSTRLFVASGFMKWGLTGGTFAAMVLRDLLGGRGHAWASTFDPNRITLRGAEARPDEREGRPRSRRRPSQARPDRLEGGGPSRRGARRPRRTREDGGLPRRARRAARRLAAVHPSRLPSALQRG